MFNLHNKLDPHDPLNYYCRNCNHHHSSADVHFCARCGQKQTDGRSSMHEIAHEFLHNTLHLDGKFFRMLRHLFLPGLLTTEFFSGRQKRYPHPTRFFLVIIALFLALFNSAGGIKATIDSSEIQNKERFLIGEEIRRSFYSLPQNLRPTESVAALDSICLQTGLGSPNDSTSIGNFGTTYHFLTADFVHLSPDSLIEKYQINGFFKKKALKQALKAQENPMSIIPAWIATMTGTILLILALMSPVLLFLFRKTRPFYVEHFLFLMHHTTTLLLGISVLMLFSKVSGLHFFAEKGTPIWWFAWMTAGMLLAMKQFYERKWREIVGKWLVFSLVYGLVGVLAVGASLMVAFLFLL